MRRIVDPLGARCARLACSRPRPAARHRRLPRAQEMFEEFFRALKVPGTPVKTFRLRVVLFPAAEEPMTPEELADAQHFFSTSRCGALGPARRGVWAGSRAHKRSLGSRAHGGAGCTLRINSGQRCTCSWLWQGCAPRVSHAQSVRSRVLPVQHRGAVLRPCRLWRSAACALDRWLHAQCGISKIRSVQLLSATLDRRAAASAHTGCHRAPRVLAASALGLRGL